MANYYMHNGRLYSIDELKHWKYIKREKINGKWRYYYKDNNTGSKYGSYTDKNGNTYRVTKSNALFSTTKKRIVNKIVNNKKKQTLEVTRKEGRLSRFISKAKNKISKLLKKVESKKGSPDVLKKGAKAVSTLLGLSNKQTEVPKEHKYIKRITTSSGKYRYFYTQDEYDRYLARQKYQQNEPSFMKGLPKISDNYSTKENDMRDINEQYDPYDTDRSKNCANCTIAYELRCRGYDVQAADRGEDDDYIAGKSNSMNKLYKNANTIPLNDKGKEDTAKDVLAKFGLTTKKKYNYDSDVVEKAILSKSGKNTRGEIAVTWKSGGAHSMVYEVDNNGKVSIRDCQINRTYKVEDLVDVVNNISITRTDNLELRKDILKCVEKNVHEAERVNREAYRFIMD